MPDDQKTVVLGKHAKNLIGPKSPKILSKIDEAIEKLHKYYYAILFSKGDKKELSDTLEELEQYLENTTLEVSAALFSHETGKEI